MCLAAEAGQAKKRIWLALEFPQAKLDLKDGSSRRPGPVLVSCYSQVGIQDGWRKKKKVLSSTLYRDLGEIGRAHV